MPPQNVKILNWNIQQFGKTKAKYSDIVNGIANMVVRVNPDIFVMVEINTTDDTTGQALAVRMATALNAESIRIHGRDEFKVYVLSQNTDREYYGFFVRDAARTKPLIPINPATGGVPLKIGKTLPYTLTNVVFTERALTGLIQFINGFCLYEPDQDLVTSSGRKSRRLSADWPGIRLPALAMFWLDTAQRLLPIFVCHYAPDEALATSQFNNLKFFSLLGGMGPSAGPGSAPHGIPVVKVKRLGQVQQNVTPGCYVLTGDFNVDYISLSAVANYASIEGVSSPDLGATIENTNFETLLMGYGKFKTDRPKQIIKLAIHDYDNFCLRVSPTAPFTVTSSNLAVYLTAAEIQTRAVKLSQSVKSYAELDKRGFESNQYADMATNFALQIGGHKSHLISIGGSLVGARLISDHLGVSVTYTVT